MGLSDAIEATLLGGHLERDKTRWKLTEICCWSGMFTDIVAKQIHQKWIKSAQNGTLSISWQLLCIRLELICAGFLNVKSCDEQAS